MRAALLPILALPLCGQEVLWERTGGPTPFVADYADRTFLASYARFLGDLDGDGCDDLITQAWRSWTVDLWILSGRDGRTLRTVVGAGDGDYGPAGDWDGDGTPDFVITGEYMIWRDYVEVRSGRDNSVLLRSNNPTGRSSTIGPARVLGGRDVTGDGRPDLVLRWGINSAEANVGAIDNRGRLLYLHVGSWNALSYTVGSGHPGNSLGWVGDVDRDGADDFVLGSYDGRLGVYVALVLSGRTGLVLVTGVTADPRAGIGWSADGCGDVDRDGVPDFIAASDVQRNLVQVFSGRTGQTIRMWSEPGSSVGGPLRSGGFDFDRDGVPDFLFYRGSQAITGGVHLSSGRDGSWLLGVPFCPQSGWGGTSRTCAYGDIDWTSIAVGRPQPGNPYPVFVFNEPHYGRTHDGFPLHRIRMYRGTPPGVEAYGTACAGTLPSQPQMGLRDLQGRGVRLHLSHAPAASYAALALGLSRTQWNGTPLPMPLSPFGFPGCSLFTSVDVLATTWVGASGLDRGYASIDLPLPLRAPGQETFTLHGQWLVLDPVTLGAAATEALLWRH